MSGTGVTRVLGIPLLIIALILHLIIGATIGASAHLDAAMPRRRSPVS